MSTAASHRDLHGGKHDSSSANLELLAAVPPGQNTSTHAAIINTSFSLLESHVVSGERWGMQYHFYKPALEKYSSSQ